MKILTILINYSRNAAEFGHYINFKWQVVDIGLLTCCTVQNRLSSPFCLSNYSNAKFFSLKYCYLKSFYWNIFQRGNVNSFYLLKYKRQGEREWWRTCWKWGRIGKGTDFCCTQQLSWWNIRVERSWICAAK